MDITTTFLNKLSSSERPKKLSALHSLSQVQSLSEIDQLVAHNVFALINSYMSLNDSEVVTLCYSVINQMLRTKASLNSFLSSGCFAQCLFSIYSDSPYFSQSILIFETLFDLPFVESSGVIIAFYKAGGFKIFIDLLRRPKLDVKIRQSIIMILSSFDLFVHNIVRDSRVFRIIVGHLGSKKFDEQGIALTFLTKSIVLGLVPDKFVPKLIKMDIFDLLLNIFNSKHYFSVGFSLTFLLSPFARMEFSTVKKDSYLCGFLCPKYLKFSENEITAELEEIRREALFFEIIDRITFLLTLDDCKSPSFLIESQISLHTFVLILLSELAIHSAKTAELIFTKVHQYLGDLLLSSCQIKCRWSRILLMVLSRMSQSVAHKCANLIYTLIDTWQFDDDVSRSLLVNILTSSVTNLILSDITDAISISKFLITNFAKCCFDIGLISSLSEILAVDSNSSRTITEEIRSEITEILKLVCIENGNFAVESALRQILDKQGNYQFVSDCLSRLMTVNDDIIAQNVLPFLDFSSTVLNAEYLIPVFFLLRNHSDLLRNNNDFFEFLSESFDEVLRHVGKSLRFSREFLILILIFYELFSQRIGFSVEIFDLFNRFIHVLDAFREFKFLDHFQYYCLIFTFKILSNFFEYPELTASMALKILQFSHDFMIFFSSNPQISVGLGNSVNVEASKQESRPVMEKGQNVVKIPSIFGLSTILDVFSKATSNSHALKYSKLFKPVINCFGMNFPLETVRIPLINDLYVIDWSAEFTRVLNRLSVLPPKVLLSDLLMMLHHVTDTSSFDGVSLLLLSWARQGHEQRLEMKDPVLKWIDSINFDSLDLGTGTKSVLSRIKILKNLLIPHSVEPKKVNDKRFSQSKSDFKPTITSFDYSVEIDDFDDDFGQHFITSTLTDLPQDFELFALDLAVPSSIETKIPLPVSNTKQATVTITDLAQYL
ncbi:hypothetical protein P9112_008969 [Eukaryota sp. TZLM1-RC]